MYSRPFTKPSHKTSSYRRFAAHRGWHRSSPIFTSLRFQDRCIKPLCHLFRGIRDLRRIFTQIQTKRQELFLIILLIFDTFAHKRIRFNNISPRFIFIFFGITNANSWSYLPFNPFFTWSNPNFISSQINTIMFSCNS